MILDKISQKNLLFISGGIVLLIILIGAGFLAYSAKTDSDNKDQDQEQLTSKPVSQNSSNAQNQSQNPRSPAANTVQEQSNAITVYSDPSFPNLIIKYPGKWQLEKSGSEPSKYPGLDKQTITLKKENTILIFQLAPMTPTGCELTSKVDPKATNLFNSGINRYSEGAGNTQFYAKREGQAIQNCSPENSFVIQSSVSNEAFTKENGEGKAKFWLYITVTGEDNIQEADAIVAGSTLK